MPRPFPSALGSDGPLGDPADRHPHARIVTRRRAPRARDRHARPAPACERDEAPRARQVIPQPAASPRHRQRMIYARQPDFTHLPLEMRAVAARQPVRMEPCVHHLVEHRRRDRLRMRAEEARRQFDERRAIRDAADDRRHARVVRDPMRRERAAEVRRVEPREKELEVALGRQARSLWTDASGAEVLHSNL